MLAFHLQVSPCSLHHLSAGHFSVASFPDEYPAPRISPNSNHYIFSNKKQLYPAKQIVLLQPNCSVSNPRGGLLCGATDLCYFQTSLFCAKWKWFGLQFHFFAIIHWWWHPVVIERPESSGFYGSIQLHFSFIGGINLVAFFFFWLGQEGCRFFQISCLFIQMFCILNGVYGVWEVSGKGSLSRGGYFIENNTVACWQGPDSFWVKWPLGGLADVTLICISQTQFMGIAHRLDSHLSEIVLDL